MPPRVRSAGRAKPLLLWGIGFELAFAAALIYFPPLQSVFGTLALGVGDLALLATFPVIVWGVDELLRASKRRRAVARRRWNDSRRVGGAAGVR